MGIDALKRIARTGQVFPTSSFGNPILPTSQSQTHQAIAFIQRGNYADDLRLASCLHVFSYTHDKMLQLCHGIEPDLSVLTFVREGCLRLRKFETIDRFERSDTAPAP
jgi:hypothetical protein